MKRVSTFIIGLTQLVTVFTALQFEGMTHLSSRWENPENRALLEERLKINHTQTLNGVTTVSETALKANEFAVASFSAAYLCASGKDHNRCKGSVEVALQQPALR